MNDARLGRIFGNVTEAIGYLGIISLLSAIVLAVLNYGFDYDVGYAQNIALAVFLFALASWISIVSVRVKFFPHVDVSATPGDNGARQSESTRSVQSGPQTSHTHGRHPYDSAVDVYSERVARMETGSRDADSLAKKLFNEGRLSHIESESGDVVGIRIRDYPLDPRAQWRLSYLTLVGRPVESVMWHNSRPR